MAYKQNPGRGPMMKTGKGVPSALLQTDPTDPVKKKTDEKTGSKSVYPGKTWERPDFTQKKGTYPRLQEAAAIKADSTLASNQEKRAIRFGAKLPKKGESYPGYGSRKYNVSNIDPKTGATTFNLGRSDQQFTVSRRDLMKHTGRKQMKQVLQDAFRGDAYLKNRK
jgi:hypothetical protein